MSAVADRRIPDTGQDSALFRLVLTTMRPHWRLLAIALGALLVSSVLAVAPPYLIKRAIDGPIAAENISGLWPLAVLYGAVALGFYALQLVQTFFLQKAGQRGLADLRSRLLRKMLKGCKGYSEKPIGTLLSRLTGDIDALNMLLSSSIVTILTEGVTLIAVVVAMFAINWRLALLALAVLPVLFVVTRYFRRSIRNSSKGERSAQARTGGFLSEQIHGMTLVQLFGRQRESAGEFAGLNAAHCDALLVLRQRSAAFLAVQEVLAAVGLGLLLYGGGQGVLAGWATLGTLVAFIQYADRAFQPILKLSEEYNAIQIALGAAERVDALLRADPLVEAPRNPVASPPVRGHVEVRDISFSYVPDEPVLRKVSLEIPAGQTVAVVGATGAGKSSLAGLLSRARDPQEGQVLLDGADVRDLDTSDLRRAVAVVPQDPICLAGSVALNIRLYHEDLGDEEVRRAAEIAGAAAFIERLPDGYDHLVSSGGENLSAGQRQLLALARAVALCPEGVLVLDEATSNVDPATEAQIQEGLERVLEGRTSIVIAHRLSTVQNADRIIVMHHGRIVEDGTHSSLLARGGHYARLYRHWSTAKTEQPEQRGA
jgi:ATP-binding cassette subfamily B multidrug efflux pump